MKNLSTIKNMNKQKGFTLIELVIVIVLLGILAATAAPKFIDLQGDAKVATVEGVRAAVESATAAIHAKALIANELGNIPATVSVNGGTVAVINGWPTAAKTAAWDNLLDIDTGDFTTLEGSSGEAPSSGTTAVTAAAGAVYFYPTTSTALTTTTVIDGTTTGSNCYVKYVESQSSNVKPAITIVSTGC